MSDDRFQPNRVRRPVPIQTPNGLLIDLDDDEITEAPAKALPAAVEDGPYRQELKAMARAQGWSEERIEQMP